MENLVTEQNAFWSGKRVIITGHTGFKGSWLSAYLHCLGAEVFGLALAPKDTLDMYNVLGLSNRIKSEIADITEPEHICNYVASVAPDVIFHLAAQSLVRDSYSDPLGTWNTNVIGTANLLSAISELKKKCSVIVVTTDKVYENYEWEHSYRETDRLGGHDPYSASKASVELLTSSWRKSFPSDDVRVATVRAGNVIGGGDWASNRIIPDLIRASITEQALKIRNPNSIRPWQHVLDPLNGYMKLAELMYYDADHYWQSEFNFGPLPGGQKSVRDLVVEASKYCAVDIIFEPADTRMPEANTLKLSVEKSINGRLGWSPILDFEAAVYQTIDWYAAFRSGADMIKFTDEQILKFMKSC